MYCLMEGLLWFRLNREFSHLCFGWYFNKPLLCRTHISHFLLCDLLICVVCPLVVLTFKISKQKKKEGKPLWWEMIFCQCYVLTTFPLLCSIRSSLRLTLIWKNNTWPKAMRFVKVIVENGHITHKIPE